MTANGNHGGNTNEETSAMFMFMDTYLPPRSSAAVRQQEVQQIDLPVTLAMLMGVAIPRQSMGVAVPSLFQKDELEHVQSANRMQLMQLLSTTASTTSGDIYELQQRVLDENRPDIHIVRVLFDLSYLESSYINSKKKQIPLLCLLALTLGALFVLMRATRKKQNQGLVILILISMCLFSSS